ncbi:phage tail tape measure protein [Paenibacillus tundrae]|uniref:TP901 family phage tail tape measure protein n=1 Tax=Paenibacillus tundrae TaxID=528187 RepID=A0ABT9W6C1_9BACL|nr:phage tail tape measure protein [Paenibacillus tundrae]MDQ0168779.1 TP901 family phage tail tape measure protein [Paenibacillus tundrae]
MITISTVDVGGIRAKLELDVSRYSAGIAAAKVKTAELGAAGRQAATEVERISDARTKIAQLTPVLDNVNARIEVQRKKLAELKASYATTFDSSRKSKLEGQIVSTEGALLKLTQASDATAKKIWAMEDVIANSGKVAAISSASFKEMGENLRAMGMSSSGAASIEQALKRANPDVLRRELETVTAELKRMGASDKDIAQVTAELERNTKAAGGVRGEIKQLGLAYAALSAAMAVVITKSVQTAAEFEQSMAKVKAISGATGEEFEKLRQQSIELGATTVFTSSQAAEAQGFLAMAGFKTNEIMAAMPGVLNLAAAGQMELARTADIASNILTGFQMSADQTGQVVDVMAKTMTSSNTNIEQLGYGMKYVAPIAANLGVSIEEASAAVAKLSDAGIQGEMAGTQLRAILLRLASPTDDITYLMEQLGVKVTDAAGNFLPFANIIGQFARGFDNLSEAQRAQAASIVAGQEAASGFLTLINAGEGELNAFTESLNNAGGTAANIAETQMDTLNGAILEMQSALEAVGITVGDKFAPVIRGAAESISALLLGFNGMDPVMQNAIIAFATASTGALALSVAIGAVSLALKGLTVSNPILLAISVAIGLVVAGVSALVSSSGEAADAVRKHDEAQQSLNNTLSQSPLDRSVAELEALQTQTAELNTVLEERAQLQERLNEIEMLQSDGLGTPALLTEMLEINDQLAEMDDKLRTMGYDGLDDATRKLEMMNDAVNESTPALLRMKEAEIADLAAKYRKVEAMEALLARYNELSSAQQLDDAQKQELYNTTEQLRKQYPDLNRSMDESGRIRIQNVDIIGDHIAAERSFIDQSAAAANAYISNLEAMAKANLTSVNAQISNLESLAKAMSAVAGIPSAPFAKTSVTAVGGISVNKSFENFASGGVDEQLNAAYEKQTKAQQAALEIARAKDSLTSGAAFAPATGGSGISLKEDKTKTKSAGKKAAGKTPKKEKSAAEVAKDLRDKAYNADLATIRYQAEMNDWSAEQQIKAYEKLRKAHAQHLKETVEDARTLNLQLKRLQEDSVKSRYDFSMTWIDKEERRMEDSGKSEVAVAEMKIAALTRVRDRYAKDSDQFKDADEKLYQARKELVRAQEKAVADAFKNSEKWIGKEERRMEEAGSSELEITQMKIAAWTRVRDRHEKDSEYYERAEDQLYNLRKKLVTETEKLADKLLKTEKSNVDAALKADLAAIEERKKAYVDGIDERIEAINRLIAAEAEFNSDADYETQRAEKLARIDLLASAVGPDGIQEREDLIKEVERMELEHNRELRKRDLESQKQALQDEKDTRLTGFETEKSETQRQYDALKDAFDNHADDIKFIEAAISEFRTNANAEANATILSSLDTFVSEYNAKMATLNTGGAISGGENTDLAEYNANKDAWAAAKASGDTAAMARLTARNEELRKLYGIDKDTGKLQQFKVGGVVQGAPGSAVPVIAHAGEMILNADQIGNLFRMIATGPSETSAQPTQVVNHYDMSVNDVTLTDRADTETLYNERARVAQRLQTQGVKTR